MHMMYYSGITHLDDAMMKSRYLQSRIGADLSDISNFFKSTAYSPSNNGRSKPAWVSAAGVYDVVAIVS
jgi:hypothetical protein